MMEYMAGGDLLQFLRNVKVTNQMMDKNDIPFLHEREKLDISRQIALGLEFLASKQVKHFNSDTCFGRIIACSMAFRGLFESDMIRCDWR